MKVRIVNEGKPGYATEITNAEIGERIEHVTNAEVHLTINARDIPKAVITTFAPHVDVVADAEIHTICPCCGKPTEQSVALPEPLEAAIVGTIQSLMYATINEYKRQIQAELLHVNPDESEPISVTPPPRRHPAYDL